MHVFLENSLRHLTRVAVTNFTVHLALNNSITDVRLLQWSEVFILFHLSESKNWKKIMVDREKITSENYMTNQTPKFREREPSFDFPLTNTPLYTRTCTRTRARTHTHVYSSTGSQWGNTVSN
jgi:hypothetical protein